jgi:hypothetical protein
VARMLYERVVHRLFEGKPEGNRPLWRPKRRWDDNTVDPRVTTGLTYEQLGLRPKLLVLTYDQSLELRPECRSRPKRVSTCAVVNKDPGMRS